MDRDGVDGLDGGMIVRSVGRSSLERTGKSSRWDVGLLHVYFNKNFDNQLSL
jgi:hypothetical protein